MHNNKSWNSIGEELRNAVGKVLEDGDFSTFGDAAINTMSDAMKNVETLVEQAVNNATNTVNYNYTEKMAQATKERKRVQAQRAREEEARKRAQAEKIKTQREQEKIARGKAQLAVHAPFHPIGKVSSVLYRVFGGIGTGSSILATIIFGVKTLIDVVFLPAMLISLGLLTCFGIMIGIGCKQKEKLMRARRYLQIIGNNHYINISDLAQHANKSSKYVLKDIRRLTEDGFFPEGHLDKQGTCFMLNHKIYDEYLLLEKQRDIQEHENSQILQTREAKDSVDHELDDMISYGQDCIRKLREMNDNIPGEEISAKLFCLENLLKEIFERLREHPEQKNQMQKFLNYYLPTTLKLVASYEQFDSLSTQGEDILEAKAEIEKTLDSINSAFRELLNRLFRMTAYDVTTDAQVLQTMLAKEGLTNHLEMEKNLN